MRKEFAKEIKHCEEQIKKCDKAIVSIKRNDKLAMFIIACGIIVAITSIIIQSYGLALFISVISLLNYCINKMTQGFIPSYEKHKEDYRGLIKTWQECDNMADYTEALKRRNDELERSLS